ncbi:MAG: tetratricopeptide repeat protein [Chloroflexi bacterium]|nr:tetratricopeptide repeat protein [Chloroflexota bacterium]
MSLQDRLGPTWRRNLAFVALAIILLCAGALRIYGLGWDADFGAYPHPDERHLANTMGRISLPWPPDWRNLADPDVSTLNPRRINPADGGHYDLAYGTLPIYIYRATTAALRWLGYPQFDTYDGYFVVGRAVTVVFALITVVLAYAIGAALFGPGAGLLGAAFLAFSVTHIQLSHFMTVDLALAMFATGALCWGLRLARRGGWRNALLLGLSLGGAMACKVSGATTLAAVVVSLLLWALGPAAKRVRRPWLHGLRYVFLVLLGALLIYGVFEFYVFLDPQTYLAALANQSEMVSGANDWPFTRQYINTLPYLYHLGNLGRWGLGWPLGIAAFAGVIAAAALIVWTLLRPRGAGGLNWWHRAMHALYYDDRLRGMAVLLGWVLPYLAVVGRYEVKFMRYMLPLVPALCVLGAWLVLGVARLLGRWGRDLAARPWVQAHLTADRQVSPSVAERFSRVVSTLTVVAILLPTLVWALAFMSIYAKPHTWHDASRWLYANAPRGSTVSAEAWDDALPVDLALEGFNRSRLAGNVTFDIYHDMAPEAKLQHLIQTMQRSDYIVLATPRLYGAIRRLPWRYPVELKYYELLFTERLGFELAHTAMSYPSIWGLTFVDDAADESFSVYDHPKVLIYQKVRDLPEQEIRGLFGDVLNAAPAVTRMGSDAPVVLPVPQYQKPLMLDVPVEALPAVSDYGWNRVASSSTPLAIVVWLLGLALVSLVAWPVTSAVFSTFLDRGYLLTKALGLVLVSYLVWMPVSLGLWNYTVWAVWGAIAAVAFLSYLLLRKRRLSVTAFWREHRRLLAFELVFLAAFAAGLLLRLGNPDIWHPVNGGEKPMEFGFLNAILRSSTMPPLDPFFSGGYINYYYYGLFAVSTLVKLSGLMPGVAFNLIIATLFALTVSGCFSVVATLTGRKLFGVVAGFLVVWVGPLSGAFPVRGRGGFGEVVSALQQLADPDTSGALARLWQGFWRWLGPATLPLRTDWFWDASRSHGFYENTITEFPFWSFLFADLHPHTINIPFTILSIALALRIAQGVRQVTETEGHTQERLRAAPWLVGFLAALVLGTLAVTNSWDFPAFALVAFGALLLAHAPRDGDDQPAGWRRKVRTILAATVGALALAGLGLALFFPFFTHFQAFIKGIGLVRYPTEFNYYWSFFGLFLFVLATYVVWRVAGRRATARSFSAEVSVASTSAEDGPRDAPLPDATPSPLVLDLDALAAEVPDVLALAEPVPSLLLGDEVPSAAVAAAPAKAPEATARSRLLAWLSSKWVFLVSLALLPLLLGIAQLLYPDVNWRQLLTLWSIAELILLSLAAMGRADLILPERFALWLGLAGLLISIGVEVIYIRDHLGDTWYRMNTIFKFYIQAWVLLALSAAACLGVLLRSWWVRRHALGAIWKVILGGLLLLAAAYPLVAIQSRWRDRFPAPPAWGTLDGLAYMETATYNWDGHQIYLEPDLKAIKWLIDNLEGTPIILQAPYGYYRENGVRIAVNTGLPTVLNPLHENEQRYDELIGPRHRDAEQMYRSMDAEETARLLAKYGVSYVYVGPFERSVYSEASLAKFDAMSEYLALVYDEDTVRIYRVLDQVRREFAGYVSGAAQAVAIPTVAPRAESSISRDALKTLERAAKADPGNAGLQFELGDRYRQLGRPEDAARVFEASLELHPEDVAMYHTLGDTYALMGDLEQALAQYARAVAVAPDNPAALNKLGMAYLERQHWGEAAQAFERATQADPGFAESFFHLGTALESQGDRTGARRAYTQAMQIGVGTDWEDRAAERLQAIGAN